MKIHPIMPVRLGQLCRFPTVADAARAVIKIVQTGPKSICRCELLNADGIEATNIHFAKEGLKQDPPIHYKALSLDPTIFMEFRSTTVETCKARPLPAARRTLPAPFPPACARPPRGEHGH